MEDFANLLQRDYGLKPQGKMAPMSAASKGKSSSISSGSNRGARAASSSFPPDEDLFFGSSSRPRNGPSEPVGAASYDDVFGGPPKFTPPKPSSSSSSSSSSTMPVYDDIFRTQPVPNAAPSNDHSFPVFDDDIFVGVPGTRRNSMPDNIFGGGAAASNSNSDDLLAGFAASKASTHEDSPPYEDDELLPGLGSGRSRASAPREQSTSVEEVPQDSSADLDPFGDLPSVDPFAGIPPAAAGFSVNGNGTDNGGFDGFDIFSQPRPRSKKPPPPAYKENAGLKSDDQSTSGGREAAGVSESFHDDQEVVPEVPADSEEDSSQPQTYDSRQGWITIDDIRLLTDPSPSPAPLRPPPGFMRDQETANGEFSDAQQQFDEEILAREKEERRLKEERERDRQRREQERSAVERATREAHERAFREVREKAERIAAEKVAEEVRARLAAEAKQKAEDARQAAETKKKAEERAAVERAAREARARLERAAKERADKERERTAAVTAEVRRRSQEDVARHYQEQQRNKAAPERSSADDLDIFGSRPSSAPKQRPDMADTRPASHDRRNSSSGTGTPVRKVSSASGIDELNFFDTSFPPAGPGPQDESADRMKARLEREKRIRERQKQALMEKHQRDVDVQREQVEKQRAAETVDAEIKRWAAGKEGNIRALLSTLQYVLWPECGWQPVGLTDLITAASVKKAYRMASLRLHPDKVQKKATVQQKYVAEKVFDLLKEAWNKFNSEELF